MKNWCWLLLLTVFIACKDNTTPHPIPENVGLCEGDIAFRLGRSKESRVVTSTDRFAQYSHVGIVVQEHHQWFVIHAVPGEAPDNEPDKIKKDPIEQFFRYDRAKCGAIMRWNTSDTSLGNAIAHFAFEKYKQNTLFDNEFDKDDSSRIYCTELVYWAFLNQGIDITEGRAKKFPTFKSPIILPSDISQNKHLEEIYHLKN